MRKVLSLITDNGSDAVAAMAELRRLINGFLGADQVKEENLMRCADHSIQLGAKKALKKIAPHNVKLRSLIKSIRAGKMRRAYFRAQQRQRNQRALEPPVLDSETRWNSTHQMNSDAIKKKESLQATANCGELFSERRVAGVPVEPVDLVLTNREWWEVGQITSFLTPIRDVMEACSASRKTTINEIDAGRALIRKHCVTNAAQRDDDGEPTYIAEAATDMLGKLDEYNRHLRSAPSLIGQFLDPAFKKDASPELEELKQKVRAILEHDYGYNGGAGSREEVDGAAAPSAASSMRARLLASQRNETVSQSGRHRDTVDKFADIFVEEHDVNILQWWYSYRHIYPCLYRMAMDYLGIPASSTSVERANSEAGREFDAHRMRLSSVMFRASMCARSWMRNGILPPQDRQRAALNLNADVKSRYEDMLMSEQLVD